MKPGSEPQETEQQQDFRWIMKQGQEDREELLALLNFADKQDERVWAELYSYLHTKAIFLIQDLPKAKSLGQQYLLLELAKHITDSQFGPKTYNYVTTCEPVTIAGKQYTPDFLVEVFSIPDSTLLARVVVFCHTGQRMSLSKVQEDRELVTAGVGVMRFAESECEEVPYECAMAVRKCLQVMLQRQVG